MNVRVLLCPARLFGGLFDGSRLGQGNIHDIAVGIADIVDLQAQLECSHVEFNSDEL